MNGRAAFRQGGVGLISMMISLTISMFLLLALYSLWAASRSHFTTDDRLAGLHNAERLALTVMANSVRTAGYYPFYLNYQVPAPPTPYSTASFAAAGAFAAGQTIAGTYAAAAPGDSLSVRFIADPNTLDCLGQQETTGTLVTDTFSVGGGNLQCSVNGAAAQTIVSGVANLSVLYGIDTAGDNTPHQYMNAGAVDAAGKWSSAFSVVLQLTLDNPLQGQAGQPDTIAPIHQVVALLQTVN